MSHTIAPDQATGIRALNIRISELENQYAELFLERSSPELLKSIHFQLQELKRELERMER